MSEFIWTDELLGELLSKVTSYYPGGNYWADEIAAFKAAKQPKPEWEILLYKNRDGNPHPFEGAGDMSCTNMGCKIHSVKRLSDGEVFTVGDAVEIEGGKRMRPIYLFSIDADTLMVRFHEYASVSFNMISKPSIVPVYLTRAQLEKLLTLLNTTK